ncbi:MAG: toll/interleukin-1 receptor domain-containing protein [Pyrinomonadaceae bacterium]
MECEKFELDVFISYRRVCPDLEWVQKDLYDALKKAGLEVWLDRWNGEPGERIPAQTERALRQSRRAVCVISPAYIKELRKRSGWLTREFETIFDSNQSENSRLIPLLLGSEKIPERIESLVAINLANPATHEQEWERLLNALEAKNPGALAPRALRFYFVKLYLCLIISFLRSHLVLAIVAACLALLVGVAVENSSMLINEPTPLPRAKIEITQIPPAGGSPGPLLKIGGHVTGGNPKELQVVIYSYAVNTWHVQPFEDAPFTNIDSEGEWAAEIHPGTVYAALLVKHGFTPPTVTHNSPERLGGGVVDFHIVQAGSSSTAR